MTKPPRKEWADQARDGIGPLLNFLSRYGPRLIETIESKAPGTDLCEDCRIEQHGDDHYLVVQIGVRVVRMLVQTVPMRGKQIKRLLFEEGSRSWVHHPSRSDNELVTLHNTLRKALGIHPWDPETEG